MPWFGLNGEHISGDAARELLADMDARTVATTRIEVRPGCVAVVHTYFVVHAEVGGVMDEPSTPLWLTQVTMIESADVYRSRPDAERGHSAIVTQLRQEAQRNGMPETPPDTASRALVVPAPAAVADPDVTAPDLSRMVP